MAAAFSLAESKPFHAWEMYQHGRSGVMIEPGEPA